jgi:hypothetical protein
MMWVVLSVIGAVSLWVIVAEFRWQMRSPGPVRDAVRRQHPEEFDD